MQSTTEIMPVQIHSHTNGSSDKNNNNIYTGKSIIETVINGFLTVDRKWTVLYWNPAAEQILNVKSQDIVGKNLWEEFAGILPLDFYKFYHKAFLEDIPTHFEEYWPETGAWFDVITYPCDDTLSASFKSSNKSAHPDFPKNSEQQLAVIRELYQFVTVVTNDCLWEWDLQSHEIFWIDGGHKRIFGYQIENALIPKSFWESRMHPDDRSRVLKSLDKAIMDGTDSVWEIEYRFQKANGEYAYVHDRGHIIFDKNKKATRMIGATQDISVQKLAQIDLLESEKKLSLIARQTVNAVIITDVQGGITWVNDAFVRITGYELEEVLGRTPGDFLQGPDTDPLTVADVKEKIEARQSFTCNILNYTKTGRPYWMHIQGQPLFDEKGNFERFFTIQTDITEKVVLENELEQERQTREREITAAVLTAQEKERSEIGRDLHDNLSQLLGAAKLYIHMARNYKGKSEMYLDKSSGFIVNVIDEIRRISKTLLTPGLYIIGLLDSISILIDDLSMVHPIKIDFVEDNMNEENLDQKLQLNIFRIVQEQVNNIIKHSKATHATINLAKNEHQITLVVSDNGQGSDTTQRITGVGLINIRSRAALYNGTVTITSSPGKGFELKVILPLNNNS